MPDALDFLTALRANGFAVRIREDGLLGVTPAERLSADDRGALKEHKEALLDLLWQEIDSPYLDHPLGWPLNRSELYRGMCVPWPAEEK